MAVRTKSRSRAAHSLKRFKEAAAVSVLSCALFAGALMASPALSVHAEDYAAEQEARKLEPVQSSEDPSWPQGPAIGAEGAILLDAATGVVLYGKNIDEELYPASTTKMMTCLIAAERLDPDDTVTFSEEAVYSVPADGSNVGMQPGETITVREALYAIMVGSANEVAAGIAEKVAGSVEAFADLMNARAKELGCTHTHFVNANGLHEDDHYTSAHDLALIARAFFDNDLMLTIGNTPNYHFTATATQPDDFYITNKHKLITGEVPCTGVIGGKTGYTGYARETLVTGCERGGIRLIAVVMKEEDTYQYTDTAELFDWGFANFTETDIASNETRFQLKKSSFFNDGTDLLGNSSSIFELTPDSKVVLPAGVSFSDLSCEIHYTGDSADPAADEISDTAVAEAAGSTSDFSRYPTNSYSGDPIIPDLTSAGSTGTVSSAISETDGAKETDGDRLTDTTDRKLVATLLYRYGNTVVGSADLLLINREGIKADITTADENAIAAGIADSFVQVNDSGTIYINIRSILIVVAAAAALLILFILVIAFIFSFAHPVREKKRQKSRNPMDPYAEHERPYRQHYDRYYDDDYDGKDLP